MDKISTTPKDIRKFGLLFSGICVLVGGYLWYRENTAWQWLAGAAGFFLVTGLFFHPVLRPIYVVWMKFAFVLAWVNTRILLGVFFFLILTPLGLVMRLFGKDFLDEKIDKQATTYWKRREPAPLDPKRYENLF